MKNILSIAAGLFLSGTAVAQDAAPQEHSFLNKRGMEVLPQKGEWALGVSATSFLVYAGNLLNGNSGNNAPIFNHGNGPTSFAIGNLGGMALSGKYMKSATFAYRARFQANASSNTMRNFVLKNVPTPDPLNPIYVEDEMTTESTMAFLSFGVEKRRGTGRVQGIYGAELLAGVSGSRSVFNYGNPFSIDFNTPTTTTDFNNGFTNNVGNRIVEANNGTSFLLGARAFVGVEYFVAPKLSLGGEFGYTMGFTTNGKGFITSETWFSGNSSVANITQDTYPNRGIRSFGAGLDNVNAGLMLHFYF